MPFVWNPRNVAFSTFMNVVSVYAVAFEQMIVAAVREAIPLIDDDEVAREATEFLAAGGAALGMSPSSPQGAGAALPGPAADLRRRHRLLEEITDTKPLHYRLAYTPTWRRRSPCPSNSSSTTRTCCSARATIAFRHFCCGTSLKRWNTGVRRW